jgi:hypothetical protein
LRYLGLVTGLSVPACSDDDLFSSADDDSAFTRLLLKRIGMQPLLSGVAFTISSDEKHLMAAVDHDDLTDLITYILEDLVGTGADAITLHVGRSDDAAIVTISGTGCAAASGTGTGGGFLKRLSERAGGTLLFNADGGQRRYVITIRP